MHLGLKDDVAEDKVEMRRIYKTIGEGDAYASIKQHQNRK